VDPRTKSVLQGFVAALVFMALAAAGGWWYLRSSGALPGRPRSDKTVIVFAATGEDGAQLAGIVALASDGGGSAQVFDPLMKVTIPGTSYDQLRDAYPFGGARAVADSLAARAGEDAGWVDVSEEAWVAALEADLPETTTRIGIEIDLPKSLDVFDGNRLASFPEGTSVVRPGDVPLLLRGMAYLPESARQQVAAKVGDALLHALGAHATAEGVTTDLTPEALAALRAKLAARRP